MKELAQCWVLSNRLVNVVLCLFACFELKHVEQIFADSLSGTVPEIENIKTKGPTFLFIV